MKKIIALIVAALFIFAVASISIAEEKKAAEPAKVEKKVAAKVVQVTGDVTAVDAKAMTITVKKMVKKEAKEVVLTADDKTKIMMGKAKKAVADIKVGDKVTAKYAEMGGKNTAKSIEIKAAEKKAEPAKKEEPKKTEPAKKPAAGY